METTCRSAVAGHCQLSDTSRIFSRHCSDVARYSSGCHAPFHSLGLAAMLRVSPAFLLDRYVQSSIQDLVRRIRSGERRITLPVPPGGVRVRIVAGVVGELHSRTIVLSGNLARQAVWQDRCDDGPHVFAHAMAMQWPGGSIPVISTLPWSCSPVLVLHADKHLAPICGGEGMAHGRERFVRHMLKHHYRLVIVDTGEPLPSAWDEVITDVQREADITVVECQVTSHAVMAPVFAVKERGGHATLPVLPLVIRAGEYLPTRHLVQIVRMSDADEAALTTLHHEIESLLHILDTPASGLRSLSDWAAAQPDSVPARRVSLHQAVPSGRSPLTRWSDIYTLIETVQRYRDTYLARLDGGAGAEMVEPIDQLFSHLHGGSVARASLLPQFGPSLLKLQRVLAILDAEAATMRDDLRTLVLLAEQVDDGHLHQPHAEHMQGIHLLELLMSMKAPVAINPAVLTGWSWLAPPTLASHIMAEAVSHVERRGWEIHFVQIRHASYHEIEGRGRDWNSRTYVLLTQTLMSLAVIRCAIGDPDLLAAGWDDLPVNTVIDLQVRDDVLLFSRTPSAVHTGMDLPWKVVQYWNVIAFSRCPVIGACEYQALLRMRSHAYSPDDDGMLCSGTPRMQRWFAGAHIAMDDAAIDGLNAEMLQSAARRESALKAWKVGEEGSGARYPSLELIPARNAPTELPIPGIQERMLAEACESWEQQSQTNRVVTSFLAIMAIALIIAAALLLPTEAGFIASGGIAALALGVALVRHIRLRLARPELAPSPVGEFIHRAVSAVAEAIDQPDPDGGRSPVRHTRMPDGGYRVYLETENEDRAREFVETVAELFHPPSQVRRQLHVHSLTTGRKRLKELVRSRAGGRTMVETLVLAYPTHIAQSQERERRFLQAWQQHIGHGVVRDTTPDSASSGGVIAGSSIIGHCSVIDVLD